MSRTLNGNYLVLLVAQSLQQRSVHSRVVSTIALLYCGVTSSTPRGTGLHCSVGHWSVVLWCGEFNASRHLALSMTLFPPTPDTLPPPLTLYKDDHLATSNPRFFSFSFLYASPETEDSDDDDGGVRLPGMAPVLRLLSRDLLTEACCMLDVKSLAEASATCRSLRDVCQGRYPWRLLCLREWGMTDKDGPPSKLGRNANGKVRRRG